MKIIYCLASADVLITHLRPSCLEEYENIVTLSSLEHWKQITTVDM